LGEWAPAAVCVGAAGAAEGWMSSVSSAAAIDGAAM
jgi:hypothetical protein